MRILKGFLAAAVVVCVISGQAQAASPSEVKWVCDAKSEVKSLVKWWTYSLQSFCSDTAHACAKPKVKAIIKGVDAITLKPADNASHFSISSDGTLSTDIGEISSPCRVVVDLTVNYKTTGTSAAPKVVTFAGKTAYGQWVITRK